jgi:hypothetical protein
MHKSIKNFTENEGTSLQLVCSKFDLLYDVPLFSVKFILLAKRFDSDITDIRGFLISLFSDQCFESSNYRMIL